MCVKWIFVSSIITIIHPTFYHQFHGFPVNSFIHTDRSAIFVVNNNSNKIRLNFFNKFSTFTFCKCFWKLKYFLLSSESMGMEKSAHSPSFIHFSLILVVVVIVVASWVFYFGIFSKYFLAHKTGFYNWCIFGCTNCIFLSK